MLPASESPEDPSTEVAHNKRALEVKVSGRSLGDIGHSSPLRRKGARDKTKQNKKGNSILE